MSSRTSSMGDPGVVTTLAMLWVCGPVAAQTIIRSLPAELSRRPQRRLRCRDRGLSAPAGELDCVSQEGSEYMGGLATRGRLIELLMFSAGNEEGDP